MRLSETYLHRIIRESINDAIDEDRYNSRGFEMLIGIPGSGKSTYLKSIDNRNVVIVCPDDIRRRLTGNVSNQSRNKDVWNIANKAICKLLYSGRYVILDATNVNTSIRRNMLNTIKTRFRGLNTYATMFDANPEVSKQRIMRDIQNNVDRANVPPEIIDRMHEQYLDTLTQINKDGFTKIFHQPR